MKRILLALAILVLSVPIPMVSAEDAPSQELRDFRYPIKDDDGRKVGAIHGDVVRVFEKGAMEITGLRWIMHQDTDEELVVESPSCRYNPESEVLSSEAEIEMQRGKVSMTGKGYICDLKKERMIILDQTRVVIRGSELWGQDGLGKKK